MAVLVLIKGNRRLAVGEQTSLACISFISQSRSCDNTLKNFTFQVLSFSVHMEIIYKKTKGQIPLRPSLGKQNDLNQVVVSSGFSENKGLCWVLSLSGS